MIDVKKTGIRQRYEILTHNGSRPTGRHPCEFAKEMENLGAGEIVVNSIDNDGIMKGYDLPLLSEIRESVTIPITALGGAGSLDDIRKLVDRFGIVGAAAGSLFVFKGIYRAVLINYPSRSDKDELIAAGHQRTFFGSQRPGSGR